MDSSTSACPDLLDVDVLVVGAGPAGSTLAALLARAGHRVLVVDRSAFPRDKACSEYMSPETIRILDRLGIVPDLEAAGAASPRGTAVTAAGGSRVEGCFALAGPRPFRSTGLSVSRRILDARLVEAARAAGAVVRERTAVEELIYDRRMVAGAVLRPADGRRRECRARLTVGADGLRSVVARRLGPRRHGVLRRMAFVAYVDDVEGMGDRAEMFVGPRSYVGLNPIGRGRTNVALVLPAADARRSAGRLEEFFLECLAEFPEVAARVRRGRMTRPVLATGPFAVRSSRIVANGAALVGDAADFFDPFTGDGIHRAVRGAELLAASSHRALAWPGVVPAARLMGYRRARRRAFGGKWAVERLIGYGMWFPRLFDRAVGRLARRGLGHTLIGVTGDSVPAAAVLNPIFLARMLL